MIKYIIPLMLLGLALSSYAASPGGGASGNSGCYTVSGALDAAGPAGGLSGTISGDIVGTFVNVTGPAVSHGVAFFRRIDQTWEVTGGIVEPLIGRTLLFENDFRGIFARPPIITLHTTMRIAEGAQKGNLELHGWTDVSGFPSFIITHSDYHGVICP